MTPRMTFAFHTGLQIAVPVAEAATVVEAAVAAMAAMEAPRRNRTMRDRMGPDRSRVP